VQSNYQRQRTSTEDSANGVHKVAVKAWHGQQRSEILLRHPASPFWCGAGGVWLEGRAQAVRFSTNLDALVYCEALGVRGVVVAFDESGGTLYELNVEVILDAISSDPRIRDMAAQSNGTANRGADGSDLPTSSEDIRG
jgi:hypothetical protein